MGCWILILGGHVQGKLPSPLLFSFWTPWGLFLFYLGFSWQCSEGLRNLPWSH